MTPSLPIELPVKTYAIEVTDPMPCSMLRFGLQCGNDAWFVLVCPADNGRDRLVPVCHMCMDEASASTLASTNATWIMQLEGLFAKGAAR